MNIFLIALTIWLIFGIITVIYSIYLDYRHKWDITIKDILMYFVIIGFGLISFFMCIDIDWILNKPIIKFKDKNEKTQK